MHPETLGLMPSLPPLPMTSKEARARGLKTYPSHAPCRVCGSHERTTWGGHCVACKDREKAQRVARDIAVSERTKARVLKTARAAVLRELAAEERRRQRDAEAAARAAARAAELARAEVEKAERKRLERNERARAARAARKATAAAVEVVNTEVAEFADCLSRGNDSSPWDDDDDSSPWD